MFPFTQQHIADALGLSLVHTNKTLRRLYNMKVVRWQGREFEFWIGIALPRSRSTRNRTASRGR